MGGQIETTDEIENYPGQLLEGETGPTLVARMSEQCDRFGCERVQDTITSVDLSGAVKKLTGSKGTYEAKTVIIATGAYPRLIGCKGEAEYTGRGVSYCATCDANFFRDLEVFVVGGGDAAVEKPTQRQSAAAPKLHTIWIWNHYARSEERRVGKECRSRWSPYH